MKKEAIIIFLAIFLVACKPAREISDENKAKLEACKDAGNEFDVKNCEYNTALQAGYADYCYELPDESDWHTKNDCLIEFAVSQKDESLCYYVKNADKSNECFFKAALSSGKVEVCDKIDGEEKRNNCVNELAIKNNDVGNCNYLYNSSKYIARNSLSRDNCVYLYINHTGNVKLCKTIQNLQVKGLPLCR
ncbi:MAG TPA: hypothetical protein VJB94_04245 [Candidatus Nanoarchaeia archaeon]|nr:hypothetical protein [Candidatus Nanoarchaeia archaeon]